MSEQLTLQVLKTSTDKKYLSKSINKITEKNCRLKEGSSIVNPIVILWPLFFCSVKNAFLWEILKFICFSVFFIHNYTLILRN